MFDFEIVGVTFLDEDQNGVYGGGDYPLGNVTLTLEESDGMGGWLPIDAEATGENGVRTVTFSRGGASVDLRYSAMPPSGVSLTTPSPLFFTALAGVTENKQFGFFGVAGGTVCFMGWPFSTWVYRVCYLPGLGVHVTFHKLGTPYFRCRYPGTTKRDYDAFELQASLGRWVWAQYWRRPYIPLPLGD